MGYTTQFKGVLKFNEDISVAEIRTLSKILGEDAREHPDWPVTGYCTYVQFELTENLDGIRWDGYEKFYDADECVNMIIAIMRRNFPKFSLTGTLLAQGEEAGDIWMLVASGDKAERKEINLQDFVCCPECGHKFEVKDAD